MKQGFTLIELLVVIAIIGVLSSVVLASLGSAREKSLNASYLSQMKEYQKALELYYSDNGEYPNVGMTTWSCIGTGHTPNARCFSNNGYAESSASSVAFRNAIAPYINPNARAGPENEPLAGGMYFQRSNGTGYWLLLMRHGVDLPCPPGWQELQAPVYDDNNLTRCDYRPVP